MQGDEFEPRLGRMGRDSSSRYLNRVIRAARRTGSKSRAKPERFDGSRIGRGASLARVLRSRDRLASFRSRRAIVKTRLVRLSGKAALRKVVLPVFLGPHKKADCPFGSLIFSRRVSI